MATRQSVTPVTIPSEHLGINPQDRVHVFIDASNLLGMLRSINMKIDFKKFLKFLRSETRLVRAGYYALMRDDMGETATRVIDMIEYAGFDVYRKWGQEFQEQQGHYRFRGSVVPEMTVAMIAACEGGIDHIVLITGDGEMLAAADAVKQREVRLTIVGREETASNDLRRICDSFVDITSLPPSIFMDAA